MNRLLQEILSTTPYLYASTLTLLSVNPNTTHHWVVGHVDCNLLSALGVYVYRDLIPFTTFTGVPADIREGRTLQTKIGLLFIASIIIPLFTPRQYIPVDPLAMVETASVLLFAFYFFLDRIILLANRESQLQEAQLYPLCDSDASAHLQNRSFQVNYNTGPITRTRLTNVSHYLDGNNSHRHIFIGLMRIFNLEFTLLAVLLAFVGYSSFPLLLRGYDPAFAVFDCSDPDLDETRATFDVGGHPWVWILLHSIGSSCSLSQQYIDTRSLVCVEAILTQLVFAHRGNYGFRKWREFLRFEHRLRDTRAPVLAQYVSRLVILPVEVSAQTYYNVNRVVNAAVERTETDHWTAGFPYELVS
ncbi:hypothetical protein K438DRAFT_1975041 [Mycena galopus ATCC 62051]|nr:hypothetical protein K438DRAFT_1975041 [Mycena galopus ATCC 62051]